MEALEQKVLWCAAKYALCLEEGDAVEAYVNRGRQFDFDAKYLPEWSDALAWLLAERRKREAKRA